MALASWPRRAYRASLGFRYPLIPSFSRRISSKGLAFAEEPLGLPGSSGFGYRLTNFRERIGPQGRYQIERKLGWSYQSNTWLARDTKDNSFVSVKILTDFATRSTFIPRRDPDGERPPIAINEYAALSVMASSPSSPHCHHLRDSFVLDGLEDERHLCLVLSQINGGGVAGRVLRPSDDTADSRLVKHAVMTHWRRVLRHILKGVEYLHKHGFAHTDLGIESVRFFAVLTTEEIERELQLHPPRLHSAERSLRPSVERVFPAVTQPLPLSDAEKCSGMTYHVGDLNQVQLIPRKEQVRFLSVAEDITPPEVYLMADWNEKLDIWQFGCLVFHILAGKPLFYVPKVLTENGYDEQRAQSMLWQMACVAKDRFPKGLLSNMSAPEHVTDLALDETPSLENRLREAQCYDPMTSSFILRCLRLNPEKRPSAADLLVDPWFSGIDD